MTLEAFTADLTSWRLLTGLSGAFVILGSRDGRHWFVRKAAKTAEGSARLKGQARKQDRFADFRFAIRTPPVSEEGQIGGHYFFEMPFIPGLDGASFLRRASYPEISAFANHLSTYVKEIAVVEPSERPQCSFFDAQYAKLCDVQMRTSQLDSVTLAHLFVALERLRRLGDLEPTMCHGDLTLENLIVDASGSIWAIDLLDPPFDHYWQDLAKLHQDLEGGWYLRHHPPIGRGVLRHISRHLVATASELNDAYRHIHPLLAAMAFVRIMPYMDEPADRDFVRQRIAHFATSCGSI